MKYSMTKNTKTVGGVTLHQIMAEIDIPLYGVKRGDLGGWIEKEENLSHEYNAWVYGDAQVSGDAQVYGDARVYGNAQVSGDAQVYGNARVSGYAQVYGDAWVYGNAKVYGDAQVYGDAWVYGNAQIYGNAQVYGNARVYGDAWVYGDAQVYGEAQVSGYAQVYGDAWVYGNAQVYGYARVTQGRYITCILSVSTLPYHITAIYPNHVQIGCKLYEICDEESAVKTMIENRIDVKYHKQLWLAVQLCKQWLIDNPEPKAEVEK